MKATLWLCTLVTTMVFASPTIYGSPLTDYQFRDSRTLQVIIDPNFYKNKMFK